MLKLILLFFIPCVIAKFRFDNYTLYKILPKNIEQMKLLRNLKDSDIRYDFWTDLTLSADFVNVLSSPDKKQDLENLLNGHKVMFEIAISNIQEVIDKETVKTYTRGNFKSMSWDSYYTNDQINAWINDLATAFPDIATVIVGGTSYEGRPIKGLRISYGEGKRVIFLEGGIHSREWISPATVCYIINDLLTSDDVETNAAARYFEWYIFPVTNPDGYIWTHEEFRMWRKNRRPVGNNFGIDLNRNWNNNWLVVGASTNPALDTYAGPEPFSEPETRDLSNFIAGIGDRIDIYLSFHSYGQMLLVPFGNTTAPVANYDDAMNVGSRAMGALYAKHKTPYVAGNIAETISTGGSIDWVKEQIKVPLVYCYELRDRGNYGFLLPGDQILPNGQETMASVLEIIHQARRFGVISGASGFVASTFMAMITVVVNIVL